MRCVASWNVSRRSRWIFRNDLKIYSTEREQVTFDRTSYAYPPRRGFLFALIRTFASSTSSHAGRHEKLTLSWSGWSLHVNKDGHRISETSSR